MNWKDLIRSFLGLPTEQDLKDAQTLYSNHPNLKITTTYWGLRMEASEEDIKDLSYKRDCEAARKIMKAQNEEHQ